MESSSVDITATQKQNIKETTTTDFECPDDIVIEELYVDDWTGFESLGIPTLESITHTEEKTQFYDDFATNVIGGTLRESYEESIDIHYERELQDTYQQRYYNERLVESLIDK